MSIHCNRLSVPYIPTSKSDTWGTEYAFEKGKYYHIRASSGKGKSTLINCLYGLQKNYTGNITIDGKELKTLSLDEVCNLRSNKISIVFQDLKLFEDKTGKDNIEVKRQQTNHYPAETILEMASRLEIEHIIDRPILTLSYGERQRCAILRALIQPFDYLLLDEPFSHLDNSNIAKASKLIEEEVRKRNACIILADLERDELFPYHKLLNL